MDALFENALKHLKNELNSEECKIWLNDLTYSGFENGVLSLRTSNHFKQEKISTAYLPTLSRYIDEFNEKPVKIVLSVAEKKILPSSRPSLLVSKDQPPTPSREQRPSFQRGLLPHLNFDRYVVSDFNHVASHFAKKTMENLGKINPLYIFGKVGMGKTHLLHALGNHYSKHFGFLKIRYLHPNEFVSDFTQSILEKRDRQFRIQYRSLDVLILDDIQFFIGKQKSCVEFFHLFNEIHCPGKQMIFSSDRPPEELGHIDDRLKSRLSGSVIAEIEEMRGKDKEKLLQFYLKEADISLDEEVQEFITEHLPSDIRKIVGVVSTLVAFRDIHEEKITVEFCRENLKHLVFRQAENDLSPERIILSLANYANIPLNDFRSRKRSKNISFYRQILMYILRTHTNLSLPEIGRALGGKANSTILFGINKITKAVKKDPMVENIIEKVLAAV